MVAKIITGKSIRGAINYNERKVEKGTAELLKAVGFPSENLSIKAKISRFTKLTDQRKKAKTNTVHVSLSFDPGEQLDKVVLYAIADTYMKGIGFGEQPFLLYQHFDTAHPHVHIVTTNIQDGGKRIPLHYVGKNQSEKTRKEIEKTFGLIQAEGRESKQTPNLQTVSSKVVAAVKEYKFTSLAELNTILGEQNVVAYRGEEGSRMFDKKGLIYSALDDQGHRIGTPVKASDIYLRPTLAKLEGRFEKNKEKRKPFREPLKKAIDEVLQKGFIPDKETFRQLLADKNISVIYRENEKLVYGVSFIDHNNKVIFNGRDVGKNYSAQRIMERIGVTGLSEQKQQQLNKDFVQKMFARTDYSKGVPQAIANWYRSGLRIKTDADEGGQLQYFFGHYRSGLHHYLPADKKMDAWLRVNNISPFVTSVLNTEAEKLLQNSGSFTETLATYFAGFLKELLSNAPETPAATTLRPKKKRRQKANW